MASRGGSIAEVWVVDRGSVLEKYIASQHRRGEGGGRRVGGKEERERGTEGEKKLQAGVHGR